MPYKNLREWCSKLEEVGELVRIKGEVDPRNFELSSFIRHIEDGPNKAILFEKVKGYDIPVVANLYGSITRCALGCGIELSEEEVKKYKRDPRGSIGGLGGCQIDAFTMSEKERALCVLFQEIIQEMEEKASSGELETQMVNDGPCKEVIIKDRINVEEMLPVPWFCERDGGPHINSGISVMRDPESRILNIGGYRHMVLTERYGADRMGVGMAEINDGSKIIRRLKEKKEKYCEIAVCIGTNPAVTIMGWYTSSNLNSPKPWSELSSASGILREPLKLIKCETVDLEVPADTEVVIEGRIPIEEKILEGPMAEYTDMYALNKPNRFIEVTAITHRKNPIFHVLMSGGSREHRTGGLFTAWGYTNSFLPLQIKPMFPSVKEMAFLAGSCSFHLVVSLNQRYRGEDRELLYFLIENTPYKRIIIVDYDIDPHNTEQVGWAQAVRAGGQEDFILFPKSRTYTLDPTQNEDGNVTKLGILATLPFGEKYVRSGPPDEMLNKTQKAISQLCLGKKN